MDVESAYHFDDLLLLGWLTTDAARDGAVLHIANDCPVREFGWSNYIESPLELCQCWSCGQVPRSLPAR